MTKKNIDTHSIRLRRVPRMIPVGHVYELEYMEEGETQLTRKITRGAVSILEPYLGIGDAWSVVDAADRVWHGGVGEWVSFYSKRPQKGE